MLFDKRRNLVFILFCQQRAGRVNEAPAGADEPRGAAQNLLLTLYELGEILGTHAPFGVRVAPPCPGAETGHVDEYPVEAAGVALDPFVALAGQGSALDIIDPGAA